MNWGSFKDRKIAIDGDWCWRSWGVTVYNPARDRTNRTIVPHRFAMKPPQDTRRGRLRTDRYYIHVYQTKIGTSRRTLRSKGIASELARRYGDAYMPREVDIQRSPTRWDRKRKVTRREEVTKKGSTRRDKRREDMRPQKWDTIREKHWERNEGRRRRPVQWDNLKGISNKKPGREERRRHISTRRERRGRENGAEIGTTDIQKLGEKLEKLTETLEKVVQKVRDF